MNLRERLGLGKRQGGGASASSLPKRRRIDEANEQKARHKDEYGIKVLYTPDSPIADIVFVHGLTGRQLSTWTAESATVPWPELLLSKDIPSARISAFGYDADVVKILGQAGQNRIRQHATDLLSGLADMRFDVGFSEIPILFVVHSLGGLVCENALTIANNAEPHQKKILETTHAIAFLGTPHCGSNLADWAVIAGNMVNMLKRTNTEILNTLKPNSEVLQIVTQEFHRMLHSREQLVNHRIKITCFAEQLAVSRFGKSFMVVPTQSATLEAYPYKTIHRDHGSMTKFEEKGDDDYKKISIELRRWLREIKPQTKESVTTESRDVIGPASTQQYAIASSRAKHPEAVPDQRQENRFLSQSTFHDSAQITFGDVHNHESRSSADEECIKALRATGSDPRDDMSRIENEKNHLLRDSYVWALQHEDFVNWKTNDETRLLWIKGDPGKGKTMLMIGIIKTILDEIKLASDSFLSYFFCQGTKPMLNSSTAVLRGLIYLLVTQHTFLISHLRKKFDHSGKIVFEGEAAFYPLADILKAMLADPRLTKVYLVVDALDECESGLKQLLYLIVQDVSKSSSRVKWLVSSRNWSEIEEAFRLGNDPIKLSLEVNAQSVSGAVSAYIKHKVATLVRQKQYNDKLKNEVTCFLQSNAEGTFLWVALACEKLERVTIGRTRAALQDLPPGLIPLYRRIMEQIRQLEDNNDIELCERILQSMFIAYRPLLLEELFYMAHIPADHKDARCMQDLVGLCHSFLILRGQTVSFVHQSAKDYLKQYETTLICQNGDTGLLHYNMLSRSIYAMSQTLQRDIYNLKMPGVSINDALPTDSDPLIPVRYACHYWGDHLCEAYSNSINRQLLCDDGSVYAFLKQHFLHWIESLSLLGTLSRGVITIRKLKDCCGSSNADNELFALLQDANRFILTFKDIIENAPLQAYYTALVFSPTRSRIREIFENEWPIWLQSPPKVAEDWSQCLQTLEGHTERVNSVAFSPDGRQLASASSDRIVRVWDAITGACSHTLKGHTYQVNLVAFFPDGTQLASASDDGIVRVWDTVTGACSHTLKGHTDWVSLMAFSPDCRQLASASDDRIVRIWDMVTGACLYTLKGHTDRLNSVAFSPDGRQLASASNDRTIRVWDMATRACSHTIKDHTDWVNSVALSPDGRQLASASDDCIVRVWDTATSACSHTLEGHTDRVNLVAFSPDGRQLASASNDRIVRVWDMVTGACSHTLKGHTDWVNSVAFSPDGRQLASASNDRTIRVWDMATRACSHTLEDHTDWVNSVAFSPDSRQLASASNDRIVRVWDMVTGACSHTLKGHTDWVNSVAFSPNFRQLASASDDRTVRVWDTVTGACLHTLKGHTDWVNSVAFSPDSRQLASASNDRTVRVWDAVTGNLLQSVEDDMDSIRFDRGLVSFKHIVSESDQSPLQTGYSIDSDKKWITWNGINILWLPSEYRPCTSVIREQSIGIGCTSGAVYLLNFCSNVQPFV